MATEKFTKAVELFQASIKAGEKVKRNAQKLAWMDATRRMSDVVISCEPQLAQYEIDAKKAAEDFSSFVNGWPTDEIVAVIAAA